MKITTNMIVATGLAGVALALVLLLVYVTDGSPPPHGAMGQNVQAPTMLTTMRGMLPATNDSASTKDFKAADLRMMHEMSAPYSGDPDVDFRRKMIPHHRGAVEMAVVALRHAKDPMTVEMAQKIIDGQRKEIAEMQDWLKRKGVE